MTVVFTDPATGTFNSNYGTGNLTAVDSNWVDTLMGGTDNVFSVGATNLILSNTGSQKWAINSGSWTTPTGGLWFEMTLANGIGSSSSSIGPSVAMSGVSNSAAYGYIVRLRFTGGANKFTLFSINNSAFTAINGMAETSYTAGATDVLAIQLVWNSSSSNTISFYNNNTLIHSETDTVNATTINGKAAFAPGIWNFTGNSGSGDIFQTRGGTGLYPGSGGGGGPILNQNELLLGM